MPDPFTAHFEAQKDAFGRPIKGAGGAFVHKCCKCGAWGAFGSGVRLAQALKRDHLSKEKRRELAGRWYCHQHWLEMKHAKDNAAA